MRRAEQTGERDGRRRVVIAGVGPTVENGRYAVKRIEGDALDVWVDLLVDGHDQLAARASLRRRGDATWREAPMLPAGRHRVDRWGASFVVDRAGDWEFSVEAWVDAFETWRHGLERKRAAASLEPLDLRIGEALLRAAATRAGDASPADRAALEALAGRLVDDVTPLPARAALALDPAVAALVARHPDRSLAVCTEATMPVIVERERARFTSWYEFFPRSAGVRGAHGTLRDAAAMLPYVAELGFDVVYLPPVHPIGRTFRKGANNALVAAEGEPGSPWAIGAAEGGHTELHPDLGTLDDFAALVDAARALRIDIALDIAFQASPDHPWVRSHPEWFLRRPDGSFQYAENPPKKYQDVYPFDFECDDWRGLWRALADVFLTWAERGVRVFRVDNPHTKPSPFWQWCLAEVRGRYPDAVFLAEAFTRPLLLQQLAKVGFSQSYTYFTWRTTKREIEAYLGELRAPELAEYLRPSFWPNTPDILPEHLQIGGRAGFALRLVLAATLAASYGIYGPAFELCEAAALPDREEYRDSEKYQLRAWDLAAPHSLRHLIARVNRIRREHPALQRDAGLVFHRCDDDALIVYSKSDAAGDSVLCVVNLDPFHKRAGWVELDAAALGLPPQGAFQVHDLISDGRYLWEGARNYVELDPAATPAHVFAIRRRVRREDNFDYYL
jgi:starch synthase (maltosyl-transferring)